MTHESKDLKLSVFLNMILCSNHSGPCMKKLFMHKQTHTAA